MSERSPCTGRSANRIRLDDGMVEMGDRIRRLRESREMTQVHLAAILDLSAVSLSRIECGHSRPSWQTIVGIAETFDVSLDYLAGRGHSRKEPTSARRRLGEP